MEEIISAAVEESEFTEIYMTVYFVQVKADKFHTFGQFCSDFFHLFKTSRFGNFFAGLLVDVIDVKKFKMRFVRDKRKQ